MLRLGNRTQHPEARIAGLQVQFAGSFESRMLYVGLNNVMDIIGPFKKQQPTTKHIITKNIMNSQLLTYDLQEYHEKPTTEHIIAKNIMNSQLVNI